MIPKIIHYCWFGNHPIPEQQQKFIEAWKALMPDYQFRLWNEQNSQMNFAYAQTAYRGKKWANLSNLMRLQAVHQYGGIYLDTDVRVIKRFDDFLKYSCFLGFETRRNHRRMLINNAIFGAEAGNPFIKECKTYLLTNFNGTELANRSSPLMITKLLREKGLRNYGNQTVSGVTLFENEYFYPYTWDENFTEECITKNTHAVHYWSKSWHQKKRQSKLRKKRSQARRSLFHVIPKLSSVYQLYKVYKDFGDLGLKLFRNRRVQLGPFQGMEFRSRKLKGSEVFSKLIGCYEECLHKVIYELMDNRYTKVIDIGCAEGYYTSGLATVFRDAKVYGYDSDPIALSFADQNAKLNGIEDRVSLQTITYDHGMLLREDFSERTLLLYDRHGENTLFTKETAAHLKDVDLIIKMEYFDDAEIKGKILDLFSSTHSCEILNPSPLSPVVSSFIESDPGTRNILKLLDDGRSQDTEWLILKSMKHSNRNGSH